MSVGVPLVDEIRRWRPCGISPARRPCDPGACPPTSASMPPPRRPRATARDRGGPQQPAEARLARRIVLLTGEGFGTAEIMRQRGWPRLRSGAGRSGSARGRGRDCRVTRLARAAHPAAGSGDRRARGGADTRAAAGRDGARDRAGDGKPGWDRDQFGAAPGSHRASAMGPDLARACPAATPVAPVHAVQRSQPRRQAARRCRPLRRSAGPCRGAVGGREKSDDVVRGRPLHQVTTSSALAGRSRAEHHPPLATSAGLP